MAFDVITHFDMGAEYVVGGRKWTSREWLAAMAMQGLCASDGIWGYGLKETAYYAFNIADAMIAYQDKENDNHSGGE